MKIKTITYNGEELVANTHIVFINEEEVIAFDMGQVSKSFINYLTNHNLRLVAVFLTHGHFDHIQGLDYLDKDIDVYIHENDYELLTDKYKNCSVELPKPVIIKHQVHILKDLDTLHFANLNITIYHTPFHTRGSSIYLLEGNDNALITGDTLFKSVIGRCDLPTSEVRLVDSSLRKILSIYQKKGDMPVYPGHGDNTYLKREVEKNIYLRNINH